MHFNLGVAFDNLGKYPQAIESYQNVIKINPRDADAYNNMGVVLKNVGRYE